MFNHHHQQQQLQQHLRQLQQMFQQQQPAPPPPPAPPLQPPSSHSIAHHHHHHQHQHHHQVGRPMSAPAQAPPPRMVRLCSASQATIMAANPMMHGAVLMQQMQASMRGFAAGGQQYTQFFAGGSRCSLLGPVPMGVAVKSPHMGFPPRHFHPRAQHYNKDFASQQADRKKESELRAVRTADGQSGAKNTEGENNIRAVSTEGTVAAGRHSAPSALPQEEPALKKQRIEGSEGVMEEPMEANGALSSDCKAPAEDKGPADAVTLEEGEGVAGPVTIIEECVAPEVVGMGTTLKVTIQQSSESRAFNTGLDEQPGGGAGAGQSEARDSDGNAVSKFFCYICSTTCHDQQDFQSHMNGLTHQQRMMEIQHMSNACLVTLLPRVRESLENAHRDGEKRLGPQRWCATCQTHFYGDLIQHRRTKEHKLSKNSSRPFCTVCKRHFRTPRKFVEHMKSPEHKQRVEVLREEGLPEVLEELITVDAVGCFEGEEDYEEEPNEQEEEMEEEPGDSHSQEGRAAHKEVTLEDMTDNEEYDPNTQYGSSFVVPVAGFLCRLCRKFFHFESTARLSHCQSLTHFQNLQKYRALRKQEDTSEPDTGSDSVEKTHGVTEEEEEQETEPADPLTRDRLVWSRAPGEGRSSRSSLTNSGGGALPSLSVTLCRLTSTGEPTPGDPGHKRPRPASVDGPLVPPDHTPEVVDLTLENAAASLPSPSPFPLQRDTLGEVSQGQAVPGQRDPPSEEAEEEEEEEEKEEEKEEKEEEKEEKEEEEKAEKAEKAEKEEKEEEEKEEEEKEEEEGKEEEVVATKEEETAMGCKKAASKKKSARKTRR